MADFDPGYSQITPLVQSDQSQSNVQTVQEPQVLIEDKTKNHDNSAKLSSIEVQPENETPQKVSGLPSQNASVTQQPVQTHPYYYQTTPFTYTPSNKTAAGTPATPSSVVSSEDGQTLPPVGLTGIRVFLATFAILLLCFFSAGATYLGMHSYYNVRASNSCWTVLEAAMESVEQAFSDDDGTHRTPSDVTNIGLQPGSESSKRAPLFLLALDEDPVQCDVIKQKKVFPNLDFALMGYHILKGFPLTSGTDSGLTKPIFQKAYEEQTLSSDGQHLVPDGLQISQDIACITTFTSEIIQEPQELELFLGNIVKFSGSGWGPPFSASSHFQRLLHVLQVEKKYLIISSLSCQAYRVHLDIANSPSLAQTVLNGISNLITSIEDKDVVDFVSNYGTHYLKSVTYGARYFYIYHIRRADYISLIEGSISTLDIATYASMARLFEPQTLAEAWLKRVENFDAAVEVETVAIGAAPGKSYVSTWFDSVKTQPMPIEFELEPLEDLLIGNVGRNVFLNIETARQKLNMIKLNHQMDIYMNSLQRSCVSHNAVVALPENTCLKGSDFERTKHNYLDCMNLCMNSEDCLAVNHDGLDNCKIYRNSEGNLDSLLVELLEGPCQGYVLPYRIQMSHTFTSYHDVSWFTIIGVNIVNNMATTQYSLSKNGCQDACVVNDMACVATSYHSTNTCTFLTSFDIINGNMTATGNRESYVSFLKLC